MKNKKPQKGAFAFYHRAVLRFSGLQNDEQASANSVPPGDSTV
jgi:hypothetical protein